MASEARHRFENQCDPLVADPKLRVVVALRINSRQPQETTEILLQEETEVTEGWSNYYTGGPLDHGLRKLPQKEFLGNGSIPVSSALSAVKRA